jgi:hypothetical protein
LSKIQASYTVPTSAHIECVREKKLSLFSGKKSTVDALKRVSKWKTQQTFATSQPGKSNGSA